MTDDTQDACETTTAEMFSEFVQDLKTADRVVIQRRNAIHNFDASYYPNPELIADLIEEQASEIERLREELNASVGLPQSVDDLIEEQAAEIERLGRELNRAKYGNPDFSWAMHHAELDAAKAEIERLHLLLAEKALDEMERDQ